ncbi:hypothetical protein Cpap_1519 [Ruminiclostridium papyrosolvens DSM 2782]|uniref:Uncharacterized protein n=1 Tax=Ruminiclostridium papyrosolvens DSM 2782 TaxID=588581 RepID=F1TEG1_9FIRM|nr:hypothetical protein [Ruminiclostridium papyrosolvens]EGD47127.1 hypothetical protein Cpap_1519 [Ruminiclostridium papyrosolvens DSM 2782]WES36069.1 hypothetical protein P0092_08930 [Ruminiclostridium papyrosolvens DSM 2782]WES36167.1 hypothetical protein P0092_09430 [Ruminiclostridium papyrosolvens DSM 2782]
MPETDLYQLAIKTMDKKWENELMEHDEIVQYMKSYGFTQVSPLINNPGRYLCITKEGIALITKDGKNFELSEEITKIKQHILSQQNEGRKA